MTDKRELITKYKNWNLSWDDISIREFMSIQSILKQDYNPIESHIYIMCMLTNMSDDYYYDLPISKINDELIYKLKFLQEPLEPNLVKEEYEINGIKYKLNLNLLKLTAAQYIDYTELLKQSPLDYSKLLAVLLVPEGKQYNEDYDIEKVEIEFDEHFKIKDALGIAFFFKSLLESYTKVILNYSIKKLKKQLKKEKDNLKKTEIKKAIAALTQDGAGLL